jgi:MSHA biogenesis protein MshK
MRNCLLTIALLCTSAMVHANTLADPTRPYGYGTPRAEVIEFTDPRDGITWNLTGVRISGHDRSAILNGRVVRAGDWIEGARVIDIETDAVLIEHHDDRVRIRLLDFDIKQRKDVVSAKQTAREEANEK